MGTFLAVADAGAVALATDAGEGLKDTAIAVITALIPLGVGVFVARKALSWAKSFVH
jgi:hypothetical protein